MNDGGSVFCTKGEWNLLHNRGIQLLKGALSMSALIFSTSCNLIYDFDKAQCETDRDCSERGGEYEQTRCVEGFCEAVCDVDEDCEPDFSCINDHCTNRWACLDDEQEPSASTMVRLSTTVSSITGDPLSNVEVSFCSNFDPSCEAPLARVTSDDNGHVEFQSPSSAGGYLQTAVPGFFPQLNFLPTVVEDGMVLQNITLSPEQTIQALAQFVGAAPDPDRGHIVLSMASCSGEAPGVEIRAPRSDEDSILYFVNGGFPTADLERTTGDGSGGYLNFRPGNATVTLTTEAGVELVQLSLTVRKGTLSVLHFQPTSLYARSDDENEETK